MKTWYFPYSAFWLTGQWGKRYSPHPLPPGYATEWKTFFPEFRWRPVLRCTPESNYWRRCRCRPYSNYWRGYSQIIGEIYSPHPPLLPGFGTPGCKYCKRKRALFCFFFWKKYVSFFVFIAQFKGKVKFEV